MNRNNSTNSRSESTRGCWTWFRRLFKRRSNAERERTPGCWSCFRRLFKRRRPVTREEDWVVVEPVHGTWEMMELKDFERDQFVELAEECKEKEEVAEPFGEKQPFVTAEEECDEQKQVVEATKAEEEGKEESKQVTLKERNLQVCQEKDGDDWTFVNRKAKKKNHKVKMICEEKGEKEKVEKVKQVKAIKGKTQKAKQGVDKDQQKVRQSWKEDEAKVFVEVAPKMRRHVVGPRGDTLRALQQEHRGVRVTVPLPHDLQTSTVMLEGPKSRVAAAAQSIKSCVQGIEAQLLQEKQARQLLKYKVVVPVTPNQRRHVIGWGGEGIRQLQGQHPHVRVMVPPVQDTQSGTVILQGPRDQVEAAARHLTARLQARKAQRRSARKPSIIASTNNASTKNPSKGTTKGTAH